MTTLTTAGDAPLRAVTVADHDWPPFSFAGDDQSPPGIIADVLGVCLPAAGYRPELRFYPIHRTFAYLEDGRIDVNVMSWAADREELAVYGREPVFTSGYRPIVRAGEEVEAASLADLRALRLGHLAGVRGSAELEAEVARREDEGTVEIATTQEALIRMLLAGRIDVFVLPRESVLWQAKRLGARDRVRILDLDIRTSEYFVTVSKHSAHIAEPRSFLDSVDGCLRALKADGRYAAILGRYGIE